MQPYNRAGRFIPECRLPYSTALVESGVADIVVHPEAHINADGARGCARFVVCMGVRGKVCGQKFPSGSAVISKLLPKRVCCFLDRPKSTVQTVQTVRARVHAHVHVHVHVVHAYVVLARLLLDNYYK